MLISTCNGSRRFVLNRAIWFGEVTTCAPALVHALLAIPEKGFRVLRVIYNETVDPVVVITVYFDDEASDL